jgi:hypothetical protein
VNASPIISLNKIDRIHFLGELCDEIEEVVEKIKEGSIEQFRYDPETASLTRS